MQERLQKVLAQAGVASRRQSEELISQGRVEVNGQKVTQLGVKVNPLEDVILLDGKPINQEESKVYFLLNKPGGYLSSAKDPQGRPTVLDFFPAVPQRIYPVGRLDLDTEGLLLLTNDGELTHALTHPSHEISKIYLARVQGIPNKEALRRFAQGLELEDGLTAPAKVAVREISNRNALLEIEIHEGRNRQVRRMCEAIGHPILYLKRVKVGSLELGELPKGSFRPLNNREIKELKKLLTKRTAKGGSWVGE